MADNTMNQGGRQSGQDQNRSQESQRQGQGQESQRSNMGNQQSVLTFFDTTQREFTFCISHGKADKR